jgi:hypothetical protein
MDAAGMGQTAARRVSTRVLQGAAPSPHHRNREPVSFLAQSPGRPSSIANAVTVYAWPRQQQQLLRLQFLLSAAACSADTGEKSHVCSYHLHLDLSYFNINLNVDAVSLPPGGDERAWYVAIAPPAVRPLTCAGRYTGHVRSSRCPPPTPSTASPRYNSCRFALVLGSPSLKAACEHYDAGTQSLQAGAAAASAPLPIADAAAEMCAALHTRARNHEDVVVTPCYVRDPASCLPVELLDLPGLQLPPDDMFGGACHPECASPPPSPPHSTCNRYVRLLCNVLSMWLPSFAWPQVQHPRSALLSGSMLMSPCHHSRC